MLILAFVLYWVLGTTDSPISIVDFANKATGVVILVVIGFGAYREWWVPGPRYKRLMNERDQLLDLALKSQEVAKRGLDTAEKVIK